MTNARVFIDRQNTLGEGALWHAGRQSFFHTSILENVLFEHGPDGKGIGQWSFNGNTSAAGIVSDSELLVATETELLLLDLETNERSQLCPLEANNSITRSNDGRADHQGGFWIGTMGKKAEKGAGAIYRYYKGELRVLVPAMTIPNAICFSPDGTMAYWADTEVGRMMRVSLDAEGWPAGTPSVLVDHSGEDFGIDGATVDSEGCIWNAHWGPGEIWRYSPDGEMLAKISASAPQTSCPAIGGQDLKTLFITTARDGMSDDALEAAPSSGQCFTADLAVTGVPEPAVILS
ncbi:MAG: SMP-30/gluconolactonase/LRE family protein [Pseudomonadota bacterium]